MLCQGIIKHNHGGTIFVVTNTHYGILYDFGHCTEEEMKNTANPLDPSVTELNVVFNFYHSPMEHNTPVGGNIHVEVENGKYSITSAALWGPPVPDQKGFDEVMGLNDVALETIIEQLSQWMSKNAYPKPQTTTA